MQCRSVDVKLADITVYTVRWSAVCSSGTESHNSRMSYNKCSFVYFINCVQICGCWLSDVGDTVRCAWQWGQQTVLQHQWGAAGCLFCENMFWRCVSQAGSEITIHAVSANNTKQHNPTQHIKTQHNTTQLNTSQHKSTQHKSTQHNTTQINTTQHNTTQHNTTQHNTTQLNTTQHNSTQHNTTQIKSTQHKTNQHNTTQYNTTQHNTNQHNTTQHNSTQLNTTHHNTTQHTSYTNSNNLRCHKFPSITETVCVTASVLVMCCINWRYFGNTDIILSDKYRL